MWTYSGKNCNNCDMYTKNGAVMIINRIRCELTYWPDENNIFECYKRKICKKRKQ